MYVKTVRNTSQILRIDCVNGAGTRKGLILHRFALSVGKDVLLHGMVCVTTVVQRCLRSPINLACLGRKLLNGIELEYVILQARYDGLSFQEIAELTELSAEECADIAVKTLDRRRFGYYLKI